LSDAVVENSIAVLLLQLFRVYHVGVVIVCDVLYGRGLRCGGKFKEAIKRCHSQLKATQQTLHEVPDEKKTSRMYLTCVYMYV